MAFDKDEVKQLKDLFKEQKQDIVEIFDKKIDGLAAMVKHGFDEMSDFRKENQKEHKEMKLRLSGLEFIITEMVRRDEFHELIRRVEFLESKLKLNR